MYSYENCVFMPSVQGGNISKTVNPFQGKYSSGIQNKRIYDKGRFYSYHIQVTYIMK